MAAESYGFRLVSHERHDRTMCWASVVERFDETRAFFGRLVPDELDCLYAEISQSLAVIRVKSLQESIVSSHITACTLISKGSVSDLLYRSDTDGKEDDDAEMDDAGEETMLP